MGMREETYVLTDFGYCYYDTELNIIYNLYVFQKYRRQGKARELVEIASSKLKDPIKIQAEPRENSISVTNLVSFYKRLGLEVI